MFSSNTSQVSSAANYIEDVFSTWLYTGTGSSQTITNNIDTTTYGGLVWIKGRSGATGHRFTDTARGTTKSLASDSTAAQATESTGLTAFGTSGFTIGADADYNTNAATYTSWTFRKQAKFFDVVTYTGTGSNTTISHNLGSVPGCIIVKRTDTLFAWRVYHTSVGNGSYLNLSSTAASVANATVWNNTTPTSTVFSVGTDTGVNASGGTYVAYLFAHNAGGFGLTGTDNVISCGSFTTDASSNATVSLGYEPQWVLLKANSAGQPWILVDQMRMLTVNSSSNVAELYPNASNAEVTAGGISPNATGFTANAQLTPSTTYIYIAIRRGPMKTPTSGTSVFVPTSANPAVATLTVTNGIVNDLMIGKERSAATIGINYVFDRLRGLSNSLNTTATSQEVSYASPNGIYFDRNNGIKDDFFGSYLGVNSNVIYWSFLRSPGFMDVVCYTGTGAASQTYNHNLGVVPELMIVKSRSNAVNWSVYNSSLGATKYLQLNTDIAATTSSLWWNNTAPTSSVFTVGNGSNTGGSGYTYVAYLFATLAGVSKVGSYTGSGTTKQIDCGFTGGARFVLIKRTDSTGDWYVWDTARGIVSGNDPYLLLNSTAAEVTNTDYIDTYSAGFEISSTAPAAINANGGSFIFFAVA